MYSITTREPLRRTPKSGGRSIKSRPQYSRLALLALILLILQVNATDSDGGQWIIILLSAQAGTGMMGVGFSDSNGNFTLRVPADLGPLSLGYTPGCIGWNNDTNVNPGTTGLAPDPMAIILYAERGQWHVVG